MPYSPDNSYSYFIPIFHPYPPLPFSKPVNCIHYPTDTETLPNLVLCTLPYIPHHTQTYPTYPLYPTHPTQAYPSLYSTQPITYIARTYLSRVYNGQMKSEKLLGSCVVRHSQFPIGLLN